MFQADIHIHKIQELEHGTPRLEALNDAIREADSAGEHYWRIYFRYEYIKESVFHDDNFKAIIMFPQLLQVFDEHPELEEDTCDDVMQAFKWVLENMPDYYQISKAEIENYYDEYEARCKKYGYSMRIYYMKKSKFALKVDKEAAKAAYDKFHECRRDANSDCEACELNFDMSVALELGNEEEALRIARPILDGRKRCAEIPHATYGVLTKHYLYAGNLDEAHYYGKLCEKYTKNELEFLSETGTLLELWSCINPAYGWKIMKNNIDNFIKCKNPMMRMSFAKGAYHLLQSIAIETEHVNSVLLAPLPLQPDKEGYAIGDLTDYFYQLAKQQSELLDARNESHYYMDELEAPLPKPELQGGAKPVPAASVHGLVAKEPSGLMIIPDQEQIPEIGELDKAFQSPPEGVEVLSHSVEKEMLYATIRFDGQIYEVLLTWLPVAEELQGFPCYDMPEESFTAIRRTKRTLLLHMDLSDHVLQSYHLQMKLAYFLLPNLIGVINLHTSKIYPGYWVKFAGTYPDAVSPEDLIHLQITGFEDSDEVWMTTTGMCCLGLRELELIGANRENYAYFADLLYFTACMRAESNMLPDAGEPMGEIQIGNQKIQITWELPEHVLEPDAAAAGIQREQPSAALMLLPDEEHSMVAPAKFAPMILGNEINYPNSHANFVRRIYLAKETFACFCKALQEPHVQSAVRLEFSVPAEIRRQCGYTKELLWAENVHIVDGAVVASIAEVSDILPDYQEGDEVQVTADTVTSWLIRFEDKGKVYTEEQAYQLM